MGDDAVIFLTFVCVVLVTTAVVYFFRNIMFTKKTSIIQSNESGDTPSTDIWTTVRSLWSSDSKGIYTSGSTRGRYMNSGSVKMECDYCACPVSCDGTPKRIDPGCPKQAFECTLQNCSSTPNCPRKASTSTYIPEPYKKFR